MKRGIRAALLKKRNSIKPIERKKKEEAIRKRLFSLTDFKKAENILFYASFRSEVDSIPCIHRALGLGKNVILPRVDEKKGRLRLFKIKGISELGSGYMGIREPKITKGKEVKLNDIDIAIIPGAGFDLKGNRLGYGYGYYDKLLKHKCKKYLNLTRCVTTVALAFEEQIVPKVPGEEHDIKIDKIITDKRAIDCKNHR